ncbi:hypothetical protein [Paenibacillus sp. GCM10023250]|uniref:hypothetical protein n=1 Tax=Paenibacillus sp. GCM10023250 TaxID=3252648 RepID=UPI00360D84C4
MAGVKLRYLLPWVIFAAGCIAFLIDHRDTGLSAREAEGIALRQAERDGYADAKLWTRYGTETSTRYFYSEADRKDVLVWSVEVDAAGNPPIKNTPAVIYYIRKHDGSVLNTIRGLTRAGMDLHVSDTEVREGTYAFKLTNNGNAAYTILSIEPALNADLQTEAIRKRFPKIAVRKTIMPHAELTVEEPLAEEGAALDKQAVNNQAILLGFIIETLEESGPSLIVDDRYRSLAEVP